MLHWDSPPALVCMSLTTQSLTWPCSDGNAARLFHTPRAQIPRKQRPLLAKHSNPNCITSFNISIMIHWDSPAALVCMSLTTKSLTWPIVHFGQQHDFLPSSGSKPSQWRPLLPKHSNPNHITSFNISIMRHWNSPAAMVWMLWSTQSPTWPCSLWATT